MEVRRIRQVDSIAMHPLRFHREVRGLRVDHLQRTVGRMRLPASMHRRPARDTGRERRAIDVPCAMHQRMLSVSLIVLNGELIDVVW